MDLLRERHEYLAPPPITPNTDNLEPTSQEIKNIFLGCQIEDNQSKINTQAELANEPVDQDPNLFFFKPCIFSGYGVDRTYPLSGHFRKECKFFFYVPG